LLEYGVEIQVCNEDLGQTFLRRFELIPALDDVSKDQVFQIRHEVYCQDLGWEPIRKDRREFDEFDNHSFHCLLRGRSTKELVGCARLIVARVDDPSDPLPFEQTCREVLDRGIIDPQQLARSSLGEVSRLAVMRTFRQRKGEAVSAMTISEEDFQSMAPRTRFPFIPVSLYLGIAAIAQQIGVEHLFVLTEPRLASHLARIGFDIRPIGGSVDHRGTRVPSLLRSSKIVNELRPMIRPLFRVIEKEIGEAFHMHPAAWLGRAKTIDAKGHGTDANA
jgi:N-acyl amino acid synthase of PEP-CTERM/exosortase system